MMNQGTKKQGHPNRETLNSSRTTNSPTSQRNRRRTSPGSRATNSNSSPKCQRVVSVSIRNAMRNAYSARSVRGCSRVNTAFSATHATPIITITGTVSSASRYIRTTTRRKMIISGLAVTNAIVG